jgi:hypothetical protein
LREGQDKEREKERKKKCSQLLSPSASWRGRTRLVSESGPTPTYPAPLGARWARDQDRQSLFHIIPEDEGHDMGDQAFSIQESTLVDLALADGERKRRKSSKHLGRAPQFIPGSRRSMHRRRRERRAPSFLPKTAGAELARVRSGHRPGRPGRRGTGVRVAGEFSSNITRDSHLRTQDIVRKHRLKLSRE